MVVAVVEAQWQWQWGQLGGTMAADTASIGAAAAAQRRWWRYQCCKTAAWQQNGGNMRTRDYKVSNYKTDDKAELMEKNFGNEGEDDDTLRGRLAKGDLYVQLSFSYIITCHLLTYHCPPHQSCPSYAYYYEWS
jgi:hypothetical protein